MSADHQAHGVTIAEAARRLGVSENAIRQRIKRGTVSAWKVDGIWRVMLSETAGRTDRGAGYQPDQEAQRTGDQSAANPGVVSMAARAQLSALVEEVLAPLVAQHEERTADLARRLGKAEAERDQARAELAAMRAMQDAPQDANSAPLRGDGAETDREPLRPSGDRLALGWRRWWRRMVGG